MVIDDFEDGDKVTKSPDWDGWKGDTGGLTVSGGVGDVGSGSVNIQSEYKDQDTAAYAKFDVKIDTQSGDSGDSYLVHLLSTNLGGIGKFASVQFQDDGTLRLIQPDDTSFSTGQTWSAGTWYTVTIDDVDYTNWTATYKIERRSDGVEIYNQTQDLRSAANYGDKVEINTESTSDTITIDNIKSEIDSTLPQSSYDLTGAILWYRMVNGSGSVVGNWAGFRQGTISGASWTTDAKTDGQALSFDGTDDRVTGNSESVLNTQNLTVCFWVKSTGGDNDGIVSRTVNGTAVWNIRTGLSTGSPDVTAIVYGDNSQSVTASNVLDGSWHHIAVTYDGSDLDIYVDGSLDSTTTGSTTLPSTSTNISLGYHSASSSELDCTLDDVRVYEIAKTSTEVNSIYNNTV